MWRKLAQRIEDALDPITSADEATPFDGASIAYADEMNDPRQ